jgi:hypothetical protein
MLSDIAEKKGAVLIFNDIDETKLKIVDAEPANGTFMKNVVYIYLNKLLKT